MKIWVVTLFMPYEGEVCLGVFDCLDGAKRFAETEALHEYYTAKKEKVGWHWKFDKEWTYSTDDESANSYVVSKGFLNKPKRG